MFGIIDKMLEQERLDNLKVEFKTANDIGATECQKCGFCCIRRSCIPTPIELGEIAEYLKLTVVELIKTYFCVDRSRRAEGYFVKPAGVNQKDLLGKFIPSDRTYNEGACIFLMENNLCKIYAVRPKSAREQKCWSSERTPGYDEDTYWKENSLEEIYPEWKKMEKEMRE